MVTLLQIDTGDGKNIRLVITCAMANTIKKRSCCNGIHELPTTDFFVPILIKPMWPRAMVAATRRAVPLRRERP